MNDKEKQLEAEKGRKYIQGYYIWQDMFDEQYFVNLLEIEQKRKIEENKNASITTSK